MSLLAKLFFLIALGSLLTLIGLRVLQPNIVVGTRVGFEINAVWALAFSLGLLEWKGLLDIFRTGLQNVFAGRAAGFITAVYLFGATDIICGIRFFAQAEVGPIPLSFFTITAIVIMFFWWEVFFVRDTLKPTQRHVHSILWVGFLGACALLVLMSQQKP